HFGGCLHRPAVAVLTARPVSSRASKKGSDPRGSDPFAFSAISAVRPATCTRRRVIVIDVAGITAVAVKTSETRRRRSVPLAEAPPRRVLDRQFGANGSRGLITIAVADAIVASARRNRERDK